jgi:hypothetical protein
MIINKVIIWGYPLYSHTHSYVHYGWYKTFTALGYKTYWMTDNIYPSDFDYTNALIIGEGYEDKNIPLDSSNIYIIHCIGDPLKYINCGARFIDLRYHVIEQICHNYVYNLTDKLSKNSNIITIGTEYTYYEANSSDRDFHPNKWNKSQIINFEAIYMYWATDLLPEEINLDDRFIKPEEPYMSWFIGSLEPNPNEIKKYNDGCIECGIKLHVNDPWVHTITLEDNKRLVQNSVIALDVRPTSPKANHKYITGYIPCRLFKNISYGKIGGTNSKRIKDLFGDMVIYNDNEKELVKECFKNKDNYDYIKTQMEWVRDHHTYVNRINDLLKILAIKGDILVKV